MGAPPALLMKRLPRALFLFLLVSVGISCALGALLSVSPIGDRLFHAGVKVANLLRPEQQLSDRATSVWALLGWVFLFVGGAASSYVSASSFRGSYRVLIANGISLLILLIAAGALWLFGAVIPALGGIFASLLPPVLRLGFDMTAPGRRLMTVKDLLAGRTDANEFSRIISQSSAIFQNDSDRSIFIVCMRSGGAELELPDGAEASAAELGHRYQEALARILLREGGYLISQDPHISIYSFGHFETEDKPAESARKLDSALMEAAKVLEEMQRLQAAEHKWDQELGIGITQGTLPAPNLDLPSTRGGLSSSRAAVPGYVIDEALRLSRLSLISGTRPLVSGDVHDVLTEEIAFRPLDLIYDSDQNLLAETYHWVGSRDSLSEVQQSRIELYWKSVLDFRAGNFREAQDGLSRSTLGTDDPAVRYFQSRIKDQAKDKEANPFAESGTHSRLLAGLD